MPTNLHPWLTFAAIWYGVISLIAFATFAGDKHAARSARRRIPEANLHLLELLGGFPGAIAAMLTLRHKTRKPAFILITLLITAAHLAAWAYILTR